MDVDETPKSFERIPYEFVDHSERFKLSGLRKFPQYAHMYFTRLEIMKEKLHAAAFHKFGSTVIIKKLGELTEGETCCIIGCLYKEMQLKPNILKEISEDTDVPIQPIVARYTSDDDTLVLEEQSQRIVLIGNLDIHQLVTGITMAAHGAEDAKGRFVVTDFCFVGPPPQLDSPVLESDCYIAFISGLGLGKNHDHLFPLDLCIEMLTGQLGSEEEQRKMSKVATLVIAGNLIEVDTGDRKQHAQKARYLSRATTVGTVEGIRTLDDSLMQLVALMDVYVMPGTNDPGSYMLPQQPLHPCMFPKSNRSTGLHLVTNPFEADFNGIRFLGTSGQNVTDVYKNSRIDDPLNIMEQMLNWGHFAPTAPDTLACCPFVNCEPFILKETPRVFFAGNQATCGHRVTRVLGAHEINLLAIPEFCSTPAMLLLNLRNMSVEIIKFQCVPRKNGAQKQNGD